MVESCRRRRVYFSVGRRAIPGMSVRKTKKSRVHAFTVTTTSSGSMPYPPELLKSTFENWAGYECNID